MPLMIFLLGSGRAFADLHQIEQSGTCYEIVLINTPVVKLGLLNAAAVFRSTF